MKSNQNDLKRAVLEGECLQCFYLKLTNNKDSFICAKYGIPVDGLVESCPGYVPVSEGLDELIASMRKHGELPEWVGK